MVESQSAISKPFCVTMITIQEEIMGIATLSRNLREMREKKGLTQKDLADRLSLSDKTISKWETERSIPDVFTLLKIAELFDCTLDDLLRG